MPASFELWRSLASRFLSSDDKVQHVQSVTGGFSDALVVQIETMTGRYALRGWPAGRWERARVLERHRWLRHLQAADVPVAVPMPVVNSFSFGGGETILEYEGWEWQFEPWLPGASFQPEEMNRRRCDVMMQSLARMHLASATYVPSASGHPWFQTRTDFTPAVVERLRYLTNWSPEKLVTTHDRLMNAPDNFRRPAMQILSIFLRNFEQIADELHSVEKAPVLIFPCFRDLWREHALFEGDHLSGFIDATAARTDHAGTDISRLLGSFLEDERSEWDAALDAYEKIRPLSSLDHQLIRVLDRSSVLLSGLTWIQRWCEGTLSAEKFDDVVLRLEIFARRLRHL